MAHRDPPHSQVVIDLKDSNSLPAPVYYNNLGSELSYCYYLYGNLDYLKEAIEAYKHSISLTNAESPELPLRLNNLGICLYDIYSYTGDLKHIEEAFETYSRARDYMDLSFPKMMVAYKFGQRKNLGKIDVNLVEAALILNKVSSLDERSKWAIEAMVSAKGAKSRLLNELLAKGEIFAPSLIPPNLAEKEAQIVSRLANIDSMELINHGLVSNS